MPEKGIVTADEERAVTEEKTKSCGFKAFFFILLWPCFLVSKHKSHYCEKKKIVIIYHYATNCRRLHLSTMHLKHWNNKHND